MSNETENKKALELIARIEKLGNELIKASLIHKFEYDIDGDDESDDLDDWWINFHLCIPEFDPGNVHVSKVVKVYERLMEYFPKSEPELYHWNADEDFVITTIINGFD